VTELHQLRTRFRRVFEAADEAWSADVASELGPRGITADIAATVMFLASPSAGHVTGQVVHVNGGAYLGR